MPGENELLVIFGADGRPLQKTLSELEADLKRFNTQLNNIGDAAGIADLNKKISETKANIASIKNFKIGSDISGNMKHGSNAVFAFNQMLREMPAFAFSAQTGILALSNNIPIFVDRISEMRRAGASAGSIFSTLGKSLVSFPSILTIGVAALTIFGDKIFNFGDKTDKASEDLEKFKRSAEGIANPFINTVKQLEDYRSRITEVVNRSAEEAVQVRLVVERIKEGNAGRQETIALFNKLKQIAPDYFGKLDAEKSKIADVVKAYGEYNRALVENIERQLRVKELTALVQERLDFEKQFKDASAEFNKLLESGKNLTDIRAELTAQSNADLSAVAKVAASEEGRYKTSNQLIGSNSLQIAQLLQILKLRQREEDMLKSLGTIKQGDVDVNIPAAKVEKTTLSFEQIFIGIREEQGKMWSKLREQADKEADQYFKDLAAGLKDQARKQAVIDAFNGTNEDIRRGIVGFQAQGIATNFDPNIEAIERQGKLLQQFQAIGANPPDVSWLSDIGAQNLILSENLAITQERLQTIGGLVNDFLAPAFRSLFDNLISGSQNAVDAVVGFLKNLVKQIISTIATAAALAAIMSAFGGGSFGGLFKSFMGIGGGGGGISGGAGPTGGALAGASFGSSFSAIPITGRIDGNDIALSVDRTRSSNSGLGG